MDTETTATQPKPKISLVIGILGLIVAIIADALSLIPTVGDVEEIPAGVIFVLNYIAGLGNATMITQGIVMVLKAIPIVQELPLWSIGWLIMWWIEAHPSKFTSGIETLASLGGALTGDVEGVEGAAAENVALEETAQQEAAAAGTTVGSAGEVIAEPEAAADGSRSLYDDVQDAREKAGKAQNALDGGQNDSDQSEDDDSEETEEMRRRREVDETYRDITETDSEKSPNEVLNRKYFEMPSPQSEDEDDGKPLKKAA